MKKFLLMVLWGLASLPAQAQLTPEGKWAMHLISNYRFYPNIVYKRASNYEAKLDVIAANDKTHPRPTLIYIHGGGWVGGTKEAASV